MNERSFIILFNILVFGALISFIIFIIGTICNTINITHKNKDMQIQIKLLDKRVNVLTDFLTQHGLQKG